MRLISRSCLTSAGSVWISVPSQKWQATAEEAQEKADSLEKTAHETALDLARLQSLLPQTRQERAALLAACALLAGALCPLYWRLRSLAEQKVLLQRRLEAGRAFEAEVRSLMGALTAEGRPGTGTGAGDGGGARAFRKCAVAVMAAGRFRRLGQRSQILFSLERGDGHVPAVSVCTGEAGVSEPSGGKRVFAGERGGGGCEVEAMGLAPFGC